ncbi:MAG: hypothetical protein ABFD49_07220 [Armatimonadota bacterium]|nr:hypothetical protein [bacterium]
MNPAKLRIQLSHSEQFLLQLMKELRYGKIEGLAICDGEPVIEPTTKVLRDVKLFSDPEKTLIIPDRDYRDKVQVTEMLRQFHRLHYGIVETLEVHNGLPFRMQIVQMIRAVV